MKKESKLRKKRKELKQTVRGRAILKLIYWGIFFFLLFAFMIIASLISSGREISKPQPPEIPEIVEIPEKMPEVENILSIETKNKIEDTLQNKTYDYNYIITINETKYIYKGTKELEENVGYKEGPTGIMKYVINREGTFNETTSGRTPIENLYEELENGFDLTNLLMEIKGIEFTRNLECNCVNYIYDSILENKKYQIELEEKTFEIVGIIVSDENVEYNLTFSVKGGE